METLVRPARADDADRISELIRTTLRESNARDYAPQVIERVARGFSPAAVSDLMARRATFVATAGARLVGTASLDGHVVRAVFVSPGAQGRGVGRLLMGRVEQAALDGGVTALSVPSSVTAEGFYRKLGYRAVRDSYHGEERTIVMERNLVGAAEGGDRPGPRGS